MALAIQSTIEDFPSVLPAELATAFFDQEARRVVGLSGAEFLVRWDASEYRNIEDTPRGRQISYLILLIPFGRQDAK